MAAKTHQVLTGLNYPGKDGKQKRAEPGDLVTDLPADSVKWLTDQGHICPQDEKVKG